MRILKQSARKQPRLSVILLDWGVRESFHLLHYLKDQTVSRNAFEVILVEYYSGISEPLRKFESEVDTWILLEMPQSCYYHKHLMYNVGVVFGKGDILMIADSDAMVRPTFVETVLRAFERDPLTVYHMDEFRNARRDLYPFNYPSFEEVIGEGSINNVGGKTRGVLDVIDPMHTRNYGACMCARREDIIAIGGADEDMTYLGHICGPYDMTFRLMNYERRLCWETGEYLYHTWHPGSDGVDNYLGPHDGRNMSTTAFQALNAGRIPPLVENEAIRLLRTGSDLNLSGDGLYDLLINPDYLQAFSREKLGVSAVQDEAPSSSEKQMFASYRGYDIHAVQGSFCAIPANARPIDFSTDDWRNDEHVVEGRSFEELRELIDTYETHLLVTVGAYNLCRVGKRFAVIPHALGTLNLLLPAHRENPEIIWTETLGEARRAARELAGVHDEVATAPIPVAAESPVAAKIESDLVSFRAAFDEFQRSIIRTEMERTQTDRAHMNARAIERLQRQMETVEVELAAIHRQEAAGAKLAEERVENLQRQLNAIDAGLAAIYRSRTWRAITRIGRVIRGDDTEE
jgi:hypothetical protein